MATRKATKNSVRKSATAKTTRKRASSSARKPEAGGPTIGRVAPDFTALTGDGEKVRLKDLRGRKVVLYFYPKDDTPGCTKQSCGFRDLHDEFEDEGALVFGISPDGGASHKKFQSKYDLPFELLVDEDHAIAEKYGAWGEKSMYGRKYEGILRSHFVIDEHGRLIDAQIGVKPLESPDQALEAVKGS